MNESLVRIENAGSVIWSASERCYFFSRSNLLTSLFDEVIPESHIVYESLTAEQQYLLKECGITENFRVLTYTDNSSNAIAFPLEMYFDYSSHCNLRCPGCYNQRHLDNKSFNVNDIIKVISELYDLGIMRLHLAGGEPTLDYEKLKVYLTTAQKYNVVTSMATNGTLLTESMCALLMNTDLFAVSISLDGWNEKMNRIRRGGNIENFSRIVDGIKRLVEEKRKLNARTEICLKPTYETKVGMDYFEEMICFAISLGVDKIKFANPERSLNHDPQHYQYGVDHYYENMFSIGRLQQKYQEKIKITNITNPAVSCGQIGISGNKGCIGSQELIAINPDGRITPCLMNDTWLGNYYEYPSLKAFFKESKELRKYRETIQPNPNCLACDAFLRCRGGCQVRKIVNNGSITGMDSYCPILAGVEIPKKETDISTHLFHKINVFHSL